MVRVFVGIMIPKEFICEIVSIQKDLVNILPNSKFVEPENLHVSLSFLGEFPEGDLTSLVGTLDSVCSKYNPIDVSIDKISLIPNENFVRVVALNVSSVDLESFRKFLVNLIKGQSYPAHITLCRIKSVYNKTSLKEFISDHKFEIKFNVDEICIIKSVLGGNGHIYEIIHSSKLQLL